MSCSSFAYCHDSVSSGMVDKAQLVVPLGPLGPFCGFEPSTGIQRQETHAIGKFCESAYTG